MTQAEEILLRHRSKLLAFIQKRVSSLDMAEDILQDSLLKALRSADEVRDEERLLPWFYRILNNAIIDTYRRHDVEARYLDAYARQSDLESDPDDEAELCVCFREILPSLKPEYAELIDRLELHPGDPRQVADQLGIQNNNLKVRRHRARQALKQRLEETCRTCAIHGCLDCTCQIDRRE
jgi:RNA polymerase sigma factor (sigma-70 family)